MFKSIPNLYSLDAGNTSLGVKNKMSPDLSNIPWGEGQNHILVRTYPIGQLKRTKKGVKVLQKQTLVFSVMGRKAMLYSVSKTLTNANPDAL